jgi:hypothetical protein
MNDEIEQLFVQEVEVSVANLDVSTDVGTISTRAVVQRTTAHDRTTGQRRQMLLVFDPAGVPRIADALRKGYERATVDQTR